jgi:hypothetical protein
VVRRNQLVEDLWTKHRLPPIRALHAGFAVDLLPLLLLVLAAEIVAEE